eukprot:15429912-Alexandrium_andersonii.AAC.1
MRTSQEAETSQSPRPYRDWECSMGETRDATRMACQVRECVHAGHEGNQGHSQEPREDGRGMGHGQV